MLRIGYVRSSAAKADHDAAALKSAGCQVIRIEDRGAARETLFAILDCIGDGDELVATRLEEVADSLSDLVEVLDRLEGRRASLNVLDPELSSRNHGRAFRAALDAFGDLERARRRRQRAATAEQIRTLQKTGLGPVEIARRLGVSRVTVWRTLRGRGSQPPRATRWRDNS